MSVEPSGKPRKVLVVGLALLLRTMTNWFPGTAWPKKLVTLISNVAPPRSSAWLARTSVELVGVESVTWKRVAGFSRRLLHESTRLPLKPASRRPPADRP